MFDWRTLIATALCLPALVDADTIRFENGRWFDGQGFVDRTVEVVDGVIGQAARPPDRIIDLGGGWVVHAFGEAHHHTVIYGGDRLQGFLRAGILYAKIQAVDIEFGQMARQRFAGPDSLDVSLAMAGLTAHNGHPIQIGYRIFDDAESPDDLDDRWVHIVDDEADLDAKWPRILAHRPDFIKIFLLESEHFEALRADPEVPDRFRGLDPDLVPAIVARAHQAGLRVSAHVRTAADFRTAIVAGVDEIAHLPGFSIGPELGSAEGLADDRLAAELDRTEAFMITEDDARRAAEADAVVVTTVGGPPPMTDDLTAELETRYRRGAAVRERVARHNLSTLKAAGVRIAIGSDAGEGHAVEEAISLDRLGVFSNAELLVMLSQTTPRMIFPERSVGCLAHGCEANFLVLGGNPLVELSHVRKVRMRFKSGQLLQLPGVEQH